MLSGCFRVTTMEDMVHLRHRRALQARPHRQGRRLQEATVLPLRHLPRLQQVIPIMMLTSSIMLITASISMTLTTTTTTTDLLLLSNNLPHHHRRRLQTRHHHRLSVTRRTTVNPTMVSPTMLYLHRRSFECEAKLQFHEDRMRFFSPSFCS